MTFMRVLLTEFHKLRRSKITWLSWLALSVLPIVGTLFMWILMEPDRAARLGLLGNKAQLIGASADWLSYFALLLQGTSIGGMILVSVIAAFVFGREYSERTAKNLLALPIGREWFAIAKLVVVFIWFMVVVIAMLGKALVLGFVLALPGFSWALALGATGDILLAALVAWLLVPVVAWVATLGKGYLAPLGFAVFALVMGMAVGSTGWGKWFPWSIVPLFAGVAGPRSETLATNSLVVLLATAAVGVAACIWQLRYADNTQ